MSSTATPPTRGPADTPARPRPAATRLPSSLCGSSIGFGGLGARLGVSSGPAGGAGRVS